MLTKADGHLTLRSAGARRLGARARRRSVAGRERDAGRRAAEAVRAARRRRRRRAAARARCSACGRKGWRSPARRARSRSPSCSCRDGGACRPRRCSPATASPRARSSRDRAQGPRRAGDRAGRAARSPARQAAPALTARSLARAVLERVEVGRRLRQPRAVGGAGSRARDGAGGSRAGDGAGLRRPAPARADRPRAARAGDAAASTGWTRARCSRCAWARTRSCFSIACRRTRPSTTRSRPASRSRDAASPASPTRCCGGWRVRASRRCPTPPPIRPATSSRPPGCPPGWRRCCWPSGPRPRRSRSRPASPTPPPVTLRANTGRVTRDELAARLAAERPGAALAPSEIAPDALDARRLDAPAATQAWRDGLFAIADAGAQVVVELCGAAAGERILDACAGIGGKTAHLLALAGDRARVDALDIAADKLDAARATLRRLGLTGATLGGGRSDEAARGSDAALPPHPARRPVQRPRRAAPAPRGDRAPRPRRSGRRSPRSSCACCRWSRRRCCRAACWSTRSARSSAANARTSSRRSCARTRASRSRARPRRAAACRGRGSPTRAGAIRTWPHRDGADGFFAVRLRLAGA